LISISASGSLGHRLAVGQRTLDSPLSFETLSTLLSKFLSSRRQGLSKETLKFYKGYLNHAFALGVNQDISSFLDSLQCSNGGKHSYFRALRAFYNWLYSPKAGYGLNPQDNPMLNVDSPKVERRILPSVTEEQVDTHGQSPWHFTGQASLDLNPGPLAISHTR
jgi:site-specific recombinase XerD